jgi:hypothetical protein
MRSVGGCLVVVMSLLCGLAEAEQCQQAKFKAHLTSEESFDQELGQGLEFELSLYANNEGWFIVVGPQGRSTDWAFVVNPPLQADNSQYMGNAYGDTVKYQLERSHEVYFPVSRAQYKAFEKLVDVAMKDPNAGETYLEALRAAKLGLVIVQATDYDKLGQSDEATWMDFEATVTVPKNFSATKTLTWKDAACPAPRP